MKIKLFILLTILLSTAGIVSAQYMLMTADGQVQGKFKGESTRSGATNKSEVLAYQYEIKSPRDLSSGGASGKRQHQPITIWKLSGAASVQFFQAMTTNETIKTLVLEFYKPDEVFRTASEQLYYKIELTNAHISGYKQVMGLPNADILKPANSGVNLYDEISIVFEKITITMVKGNMSATDDWSTAR